MFTTRCQDTHCLARTGQLETAHGSFDTPAFVAVATRGTVKAVEPNALKQIGVQLMISNAYHLHLRPGEDLIARLNGLHRFAGWDGPMMTDSGGFQVFSLGAGKVHGVGKVASIFPDEACSTDRPQAKPQGKPLVTLDEQGVTFRSIIDGSTHFFSPENVITLQRKLGADIALVLDECTSPLHDFAYTKAAMDRTHRWAKRALRAFDNTRGDTYPNADQLLYGIVQGGAYQELRSESARIIGGLPFDGFAIGGSLGRSKQDMHNVLDWSIPLLPAEKGRHLLGIGQIEDIFAAVKRGIDTFDCASPTRIARNGTVFVKGAPRHRINLRNARFRNDPRPIDEGCDCATCRHHSRAYLRHLLLAGELSYYRLATIHNLRFLVRLMRDIREAIGAGTLSELEQEWQVSTA